MLRLAMWNSPSVVILGGVFALSFHGLGQRRGEYCTLHVCGIVRCRGSCSEYLAQWKHRAPVKYEWSGERFQRQLNGHLSSVRTKEELSVLGALAQVWVGTVQE
jgi:hypothetical protein